MSENVSANLRDRQNKEISLEGRGKRNLILDRQESENQKRSCRKRQTKAGRMTEEEFNAKVFIPLVSIRYYSRVNVWRSMKAYVERVAARNPESDMKYFSGDRSEFNTQESTQAVLDWINSMLAFPQTFEVHSCLLYIMSCCE